MGDPEATPVGRDVHRVLHHLNATELVIGEAPREFVVVAGHINDAATLAPTPQQLLHHVVMRLGPKPTATQLPAVDDVAHQVQIVTGVVFEKLQKLNRLTTRRAQMQVRNENRAVMLVTRWKLFIERRLFTPDRHHGFERMFH